MADTATTNQTPAAEGSPNGRKQVKVKTREHDQSEGLAYYRMMQLIRRFEERCAEMYARGKIGGFLHLYIGEEAIAVGAMAALEPHDYITSHYREHGHALARGMNPKIVMAELFGKTTGSSKGKGGSMHLFDAAIGFYGGSAIVGGQMPIGVGLALASKMQDDCKRVSLCFIGDGAVQEGEFHESLNIAALWNLPIVFLCENNGYGMGTPVEDSFAGHAIFERAAGYGMPGHRADGMDPDEVRQIVQQAVQRARNGDGPTLIEVITYRFRGHSMADPVQYRQKDEEERWKLQDPIVRWKAKLLADGVTESEIEALDAEALAEVDAAVDFAEQSPFPTIDDLFSDTYAPAEWVDRFHLNQQH